MGPFILPVCDDDVPMRQDVYLGKICRQKTPDTGDPRDFQQFRTQKPRYLIGLLAELFDVTLKLGFPVRVNLQIIHCTNETAPDPWIIRVPVPAKQLCTNSVLRQSFLRQLRPHPGVAIYQDVFMFEKIKGELQIMDREVQRSFDMVLDVFLSGSHIDDEFGIFTHDPVTIRDDKTSLFKVVGREVVAHEKMKEKIEASP